MENNTDSTPEFAHSTVTVRTSCRTCRKGFVAIAVEDDFARWLAGEALIQEAMPETTPEVREIFIGWRSGFYICPDCWPTLEED